VRRRGRKKSIPALLLYAGLYLAMAYLWWLSADGGYDSRFWVSMANLASALMVFSVILGDSRDGLAGGWPGSGSTGHVRYLWRSGYSRRWSSALSPSPFPSKGSTCCHGSSIVPINGTKELLWTNFA